MLPPGVPAVSVEAGVDVWLGIVGPTARVGIDRFGASAPGAERSNKLGINVDNVVAHAQELIDRN